MVGALISPAALLVALALVAPGAAAPAHRYTGSTAQEQPISFRLSPDGRRLDRVSVTYLMACDAEIALQRADTFPGALAVRPDGRFSGVLGGRLTFKGRIVGARASGTFRARVAFGGTASCTGPVVPWRARTS